jgi:hypothetical protein
MRLPYVLLALALLNTLALSVPTDDSSPNFAGAAIEAAHTHADPVLDQVVKTSEKVFVGSIKSNKYHYPSCQWAEKINPENEIWFSSSQDARDHGYMPCKVCKPP